MLRHRSKGVATLCDVAFRDETQITSNQVLIVQPGLQADMGQQQSTTAPSEAPPEGSGESVRNVRLQPVTTCKVTIWEAQPNVSCVQSGVGIRLFQFQQNAAGGSWELCSSSPDMNFYDINEDSATKKKEWHLELGSEIDIPVTDQFSVDATSKRVTLAADTAVYALRFPTAAALQMFESEYNSRLFENTYGMKYDDKNRDQVTTVH